MIFWILIFLNLFVTCNFFVISFHNRETPFLVFCFDFEVMNYNLDSQIPRTDHYGF